MPQPITSAKNLENKISSVLSNTVSSQSFCHRPYNNFIVRCRIPNFHCHGNKGQSMANFSDTVILSALKDPVFGARVSTISLISRVKGNFLLILLNFRYRGNNGQSGVNFNDTVKLLDVKSPMSDARFLTLSLI